MDKLINELVAAETGQYPAKMQFQVKLLIKCVLGTDFDHYFRH